MKNIINDWSDDEIENNKYYFNQVFPIYSKLNDEELYKLKTENKGQTLTKCWIFNMQGEKFTQIFLYFFFFKYMIHIEGKQQKA